MDTRQHEGRRKTVGLGVHGSLTIRTLRPLVRAILQAADPTGISNAPSFIVSSDGQISFLYVGRIKVAGLIDMKASAPFEKR